MLCLTSYVFKKNKYSFINTYVPTETVLKLIRKQNVKIISGRSIQNHWCYPNLDNAAKDNLARLIHVTKTITDFITPTTSLLVTIKEKIFHNVNIQIFVRYYPKIR